MNDQERITQLESMLAEEREKVSRFLFNVENYARGLDMMAHVAYSGTLSGSHDEKNARAVKQHTGDMLGWLGVKAEELRGLMGRAMSAEEEVPAPPAPAEDAEQPQPVTIH